MSDLAAAAANIGAPEELVMRSARARAEISGATPESILAAWAGGGSVPTAAPAEEAPTPAEAPAAEEAPTEPTREASEPVAVAAAAATPVAAPAIAAAPIPETVTIEESYEWDQVTTVTTAGLKERTKSVLPMWMVALFSIIPIFAVGYMTINSGGPTCGEAGQLAVDFTNTLVNCDLTAYEGVGGGSGGDANFVAIGSSVYTANCSSCHGGSGQGGAGPQLSGGAVASTFGACGDHITWVNLGTNGWRDAIGNTYGDTDKPVGGAGAMSGFETTLTAEEIASVVLYERVVFGGTDLDATLSDCGLVAEEEPAEDGEGTDGEEEMESEALAP